jgi:hypothetical protein
LSAVAAGADAASDAALSAESGFGSSSAVAAGDDAAPDVGAAIAGVESGGSSSSVVAAAALSDAEASGESAFGSMAAAAADSFAVACPDALESAVAGWLASAAATCTWGDGPAQAARQRPAAKAANRPTDRDAR